MPQIGKTIKKIPEKNTLIIFVVIGALTAIIYFSLFNLFFQKFKLNYKISFSIAYILSIGFYFFTNRKYSFQEHKSKLQPQLVKYIAMIGINYLITLLILQIIVKILLLSPVFGLVLAAGITFLISYILSRFWVFSKKQKQY
jgi:putative flippase GtrA